MKQYLFNSTVGRITLGIVLLILLTVAALDIRARSILSETYEISSNASALPPGEATRGERLASTVLACTECHGPDLGGQVVQDIPLFGRVAAPNLTSGRGGIATDYADSDWERAIRHGVKSTGEGLVMMPSDGYSSLSNQDVADLIAYLKQLPPVHRIVEPTQLGLLGRQLAAFGKLPVPARTIDHAAVGSTDAPQPAVTPEYGSYLAKISGCQGCHGQDFQGHSMGPALPPAPSLTPDALSTWTLDEFSRAIRRGEVPDGRQLAPIMPYKSFAEMSDDNVEALFIFLRSR